MPVTAFFNNDGLGGGMKAAGDVRYLLDGLMLVAAVVKLAAPPTPNVHLSIKNIRTVPKRIHGLLKR